MIENDEIQNGEIENRETAPAPRGLPGGIPLPFGLLVLSFGLFISATLFPDSFDLGPHFNAAGIGVLGASCTMFWLLIAVAKRPPPPSPRR